MTKDTNQNDLARMKADAQAFITANPDLKFVDAFFSDLNGVLRGKRMLTDAAMKLFESGLRLPRSLVGVDIWGADVLDNGLVMETGDVDGLCFPVCNGLTPTPWTNEPSAQIMLMMGDTDGGPFAADPRQLLIEMKNRCAAHGLFPVAAMELEFYLLSHDTDELGRPLTPTHPVTGRRVSDAKLYAMNELDAYAGFFADLYAACETQGVPLGATIVEGGAGQFEVNLLHQDDPVLAADQAILFRRAVKGVADKHGLLSTFMAKPFGDLAGNGLHVHMSMLDKNGANVFDNGGDDGSALLHQAIAGLIEASPEAMIFLAPHLNSMRRFQDASHAPTRLAWGYENRTAAIRIPNDSIANRRFEYRIAGADANPYLVMAALLAGVLHGVENNLTPPPATTGNAYESETAKVPTSWREAVNAFAEGKILPAMFGELFTSVFCAVKRQEMRVANGRVTDFEYDTYLQPSKQPMLGSRAQNQTSADSYYAATAHSAIAHPALDRDIEVDVAIVGGGFTGVASALSLAERGFTVAIVDAHQVGWGASGRNGGQVLAGWSGDSEFVKQVGEKAEEFLWRTRYLGNEIIEARLKKYSIECDYTLGAATVALNARQMTMLEAEFSDCAAHGQADMLSLVDDAGIRRHVGSAMYCGGLIDRRGAHCHPLNLCLGEAAAAASLGVQIFENTQVTSIEHGTSPVVITDNGRIRAKHVILAGNAYHTLEKKRLDGYMLPAKTYVLTTEPLDEATASNLLPDNLAFCDANWVLDYFRLTADRRLLFGGRCTYSNRDIDDIEGSIAPRMREVFPQLENIKTDYAWGGVIGIPLNRVPLIGRVSENVLFAQGYAGHGVNCSHIVGEMFADAIEGQNAAVDLFESTRHFKIPAADQIGGPILALGMSYFRLRDRLGI